MSLWNKMFGQVANPCSEINLPGLQAKAIQPMYSSSQNAWISNQLGGINGHYIHVPDTSHLPPNVQTVHIGTDANNHSIYVDYNTGNIYIVGAAGSAGLSQEEVARLKELIEERARATKQAKVDIFKKLPASVRQMVVDQLVWSETVAEINKTEAPKTDEEIALENKDFNPFGGSFRAGYVGGGFSGGYSQMDYPFIRSGIDIPKDFTAEELKRAHNEATLEEELLGSTESK